MIIKHPNVNAYIQSFPKDVQLTLEEIRAFILKIAPQAVESISYHMPAYKINGKILVYFAAYKNHIGFYALPNTHAAFAHQLSPYKQGKGSVQFPLKQPIPFDLIEQMLTFRLQQIIDELK
jgi:uncharacterized protein YdhG (YjbR/CyaY superfamily)